MSTLTGPRPATGSESVSFTTPVSRVQDHCHTQSFMAGACHMLYGDITTVLVSSYVCILSVCLICGLDTGDSALRSHISNLIQCSNRLHSLNFPLHARRCFCPAHCRVCHSRCTARSPRCGGGGSLSLVRRTCFSVIHFLSRHSHFQPDNFDYIRAYTRLPRLFVPDVYYCRIGRSSPRRYSPHLPVSTIRREVRWFSAACRSSVWGWRCWEVWRELVCNDGELWSLRLACGRRRPGCGEPLPAPRSYSPPVGSAGNSRRQKNHKLNCNRQKTPRTKIYEICRVL